ncbi:hypothetical protein [Candidatus Nanohalobium constans]|uniref:Uncharacterized protein n=1 Tax=Candidatus Nanohalobium constans TaxID=2565781 RepID=A0A5Q0UFB8_9ARCH|nr:hypothetical protein [Candidatus Nanohalobium constans]QGA80303.1 hypothetical protein LC1Nh_0402 [Candidatus Nanohalobium constans]
MGKIGEIGLKTSAGTPVKLPVYQLSDFSETPSLKIKVGSEIGGLNLVDPSNSDATPVKVKTANDILAISTTGPSTGPTATVDATLNSQTAEITIFEDTTGSGTADNTETITINDGTNTTTLSNIQGGTGNKYWIKTTLTNSNMEKTAEINSIELSV